VSDFHSSNSFEWHVRRIAHLRELGVQSVTLNASCGDLPWGHVDEVTANVAGQIEFWASHPCGITFDWYLPLPLKTDPLATALGLADACSTILDKLPVNMRVKASAIMWDKINTMRARAVRLREEVAIIETVEREAGAAIKAKVLP
jgi:hypothetical protein